MADHPKFIQITTCAVVQPASGQIVRELFALDENGDVWSYWFAMAGSEKEMWKRLSTERT